MVGVKALRESVSAQPAKVEEWEQVYVEHCGLFIISRFSLELVFRKVSDSMVPYLSRT